MKSFDELVAEGEAEPVEGWDFSWFAGRATEERPSWGYARIVTERVADADAMLDLQTGGGEVYAEVLGGAARVPTTVTATEGWPPNLEVAADRLRPFGGEVRHVLEDGDLPFRDASYDLVVSRHPTTIPWGEVARVLRPGGTFLCQGIESGTNRELSEAMMGPLPPIDEPPASQRDATAAREAGLEVLDVRSEALRVSFRDVGAVVYFLRKVLWTVPGFSVDRYRAELLAVHEQIQRDGEFVSHASRFLIEARKPG